MLQKLENAYLAILRLVVIVFSGILLISVVIFGLSSLKGFGDGPGDEIEPPKISADEIINRITAPEDVSDGKSDETKDHPKPNHGKADPNKQYYDAAASQIVTFVTKVSGGTEGLKASQVYVVTKDRAEAFGTEELVAAYAKGFSEAAAKILSDKKIESLAKSTSSVDVVNHILNTYTAEFKSKLQAEHDKINEEKLQHAQAKAESATNLYLAGASFGLFLLIVFLSIFIKIERNLRHLEIKAQ